MPVTPITEVPPKRRRRSSSSEPPEPPPVPTWQTPTSFPEHAAPILRKTRIRRSQYAKATQELALFLLANLSGDWVIALQAAIRKGDKDAVKLLAQAFGIIKNESGVTVNLQQNNVIQGQQGPARQIDNLVRMLDERDRVQLLEATPLVATEDREEEEDDEEEE